MKTILISGIAAISAFVLLTMFTGCNQGAFKSQIKTVDSLQTVMAELEEIFNAVDFDHHKANREDMMNDMQRVERYFISRGDTMPRDIALKLSDYRLVWKGYKRMESEYGIVGEEIAQTVKQLRTLHQDLRNNALSELHANRFLKEELEFVRNLELNTRSFDSKMELTEGKYKIQKPVIVQLADSLENTQKTQ